MGTGILITANDIVSSDQLTVKAADVLKDKTYIGADTNDGAGIGTMPNQGAKTSALNCGGSYTIPAGYHNGSGKITANSLASQTSATAKADEIFIGKTAYVNGTKLIGTMKPCVVYLDSDMPMRVNISESLYCDPDYYADMTRSTYVSIPYDSSIYGKVYLFGTLKCKVTLPDSSNTYTISIYGYGEQTIYQRITINENLWVDFELITYEVSQAKYGFYLNNVRFNNTSTQGYDVTLDIELIIDHAICEKIA